MPLERINRFKRKLPSFNTVKRGATATANLPIGAAYRSIDLLFTKVSDGTPLTEAQIKKTIKRVKLLINGRARWEISAKHIIDLLNRYKTLPFAAGILHLPLVDLKLKATDAEDLLRWGTADVSTFDIEVEVANIVQNDVNDVGEINIKGEALVDNVSEPLGVIREIHEFSYAATVAGKFEVADLPKGNGDLVEMHIDCANKIKELEFKCDNTVYLEGDLNAYNEHLKRNGERTPQSGYVHHDPCFMRRLRDCFRMDDKQDIRYYLDMTQAQDLSFVMITVQAPNGYITKR